MPSDELPAVAIVGRPNVGKSTLFNRIVGRRRALVDDEPGVTRDRLIARAKWADREFTIIDTGGFEAESERDLARRVRAQSLRAVADASVVLFVVDGRAGLSPADRAVARTLADSGKPVVCVVNKVDGLKQEALAYEYFALGLGEPQPVSAEHGGGILELLDRMVELLPPTQTPAATPALRVALVGRPNVGKSSILNRLVGDERALVDSAAGTTRDSIDILIQADGDPILLVDTAGIRRKSRIERRLEKASVASALHSLERAEIVLLVVDATEGLTDQDARIARLVWERGRALVLVVNKWDRVPTALRDPEAFLREARRVYPHLVPVPAVVVSALRGMHLDEILPAARRAGEAHRLRLPTHRLNQVLGEALAAALPPLQRGKRARVYYATALGTSPPSIALFVNHPDHVTTAYLRYLENRLREAFPLEGTPLRIVLRARSRTSLGVRPSASRKPGKVARAGDRKRKATRR
ncbi:MAG TPA: ribosome biogenesis GTPase Der [Candidatus Binatia bacterium]|nr:ribosome biogenesis GTPase Der [Candidatus Binatia bacterium]